MSEKPDSIDLRSWDGGPAAWIPGQAEGAIPNGVRIRKTRMERGDVHQIGDEAIILSSIGPMPADAGVPREWVGTYGYFVHWDDVSVPVFIHGSKIEPVR